MCATTPGFLCERYECELALEFLHSKPSSQTLNKVYEEKKA